MLRWPVLSPAKHLVLLVGRDAADNEHAPGDQDRQPDPADQTHFTIRYQAAEVTGTIHGWVETGGKVRFEVRRGDGITTGETAPAR
jgi:hypothetical protein